MTQDLRVILKREIDRRARERQKVWDEIDETLDALHNDDEKETRSS